MRLHECSPTDACPCGNDAMPQFNKCCLTRPWVPREVIPNQASDDGSIIHAFSIFRRDETAAIVFPEKTFTLYVHPALDMVELDKFLCTGDSRREPPPVLAHPLARLKELCGGFPDDRVLVLSNGAAGAYKFQGNEADIMKILRDVWHWAPAPRKTVVTVPATVQQMPAVTGACDCGVDGPYGDACDVCGGFHTR